MRNDDQDWVRELHRHGTHKIFEAGEPVFLHGESAQTIGLVISGQAIAKMYSKEGQETWIDTFDKGSFIGHTSFLTDTLADYEITAETTLGVLFVTAQMFHSLRTRNTNLSNAISLDLAVRLTTMTNRLVEAVTLSSPGRVCAELLRMSNPIGVDPDKLIVRPNPVFVDMALRINSTRETVSRTISSLQKSGVLSREPGAILIHNSEELRRQVK